MIKPKKIKGAIGPKEALSQLMTLVSLAAQRGDEVALKLMDEVQTILTTDWDDIPQEMKEQMAYVTAKMLTEKVKYDQEEEG